jgi:tRNA pseudouridine38-40 synthase
MSEQRWKCVCAYDGGAFAGWQSQACKTAVQDVLEARLEAIFGHPVRIHGSGRTDSGVHARAQVFHFDAHWRATPQALCIALNTGLVPDVRIVRVSQVTNEFHARYSVTGKEYRYQILTEPPSPFEYRYWWYVPKKMDEGRMREGMQVLQGTHDYTSFAAGVEDGDNPVKTVHRIELNRTGHQWELVFQGSGFLYKMVRSLTGSLVYVAQGRLEIPRLEALLLERRRTEEVYTAPAHGLFLHQVFY